MVTTAVQTSVQVLSRPGKHTNRPSSNTPDNTLQASTMFTSVLSLTRGSTSLELSQSECAGSVFFPRDRPERMTDRKQGPLALDKPSDGYGKRVNPALGSCSYVARDMRITADDGYEMFPASPQITRSMSCPSDGGRGRARCERTDRNHLHHAADHRQCGIAKVESMNRMDSRSNEDKDSVESDVEGPRATSQELPKQGNSADGTGERLKELHQRLQEARDASDNDTLTPEHYSRVDGAINDAIHHLPLVHFGDGSGPLHWRVPDQVSENEDMVPHHLVERFRNLLKGHEGHLGDLLLNSKTQPKLRAIFPGLEEKELHRLLNETQAFMEASAEPHKQFM